MFFHCDVCGFEEQYLIAPTKCPVCGLGTMRQGQAAAGFSVVNGDLVARGIVCPDYQPVWQGAVLTPESFNYFAGIVGASYLKFIREKTTYVGRFTNIMVPEDERFAWLTPYTGNKHNRTYFTQLLLACVAKAKFKANGGKFPRLIEPFVGSGQIFLHASHWGSAFNQGVPLFHEVIAGDLNPYVIAAYKLFLAYGNTAADDYELSAKSLDAAGQFAHVQQHLHSHGLLRLTNTQNPGEMHEAAAMYIWLVNRCLRGSSYNSTTGGVNATQNVGLDLTEVRKREKRTIANVSAALRSIRFSAECRDFAVTCQLAQPGDIVFMDCPFPKFSYAVPTQPLEHPETFGSATANTYGTGDDGAALQTRIVAEADRLTEQGTTVILCNFANPGLILAYEDLLPMAMTKKQVRHHIYTYRSPSTQSEAYQLVILPGHGVNFDDLPATLCKLWTSVGGDNGFEVDSQEYFDSKAETEMELDEPSYSDPDDTNYVPGRKNNDYTDNDSES
jgi:site-specific DNA-adenine methylase